MIAHTWHGLGIIFWTKFAIVLAALGHRVQIPASGFLAGQGIAYSALQERTCRVFLRQHLGRCHIGRRETQNQGCQSTHIYTLHTIHLSWLLMISGVEQTTDQVNEYIRSRLGLTTRLFQGATLISGARRRRQIEGPCPRSSAMFHADVFSTRAQRIGKATATTGTAPLRCLWHVARPYKRACGCVFFNHIRRSLRPTAFHPLSRPKPLPARPSLQSFR